MTKEEFDKIEIGQYIWITDNEEVYKRRVARKQNEYIVIWGTICYVDCFPNEVYLTKRDALIDVYKSITSDVVSYQEKIDALNKKREELLKKIGTIKK